MLKRLLDIITSFLGLLTLLPLTCIIVILIKVETPGPAFFVQTRIGYKNRPFMMYKFRKFPYGSVGGPGVTMVKDPRMTRMGKILERFKLDELPQFLNVFLGQMSIVGPRPETPNFVKYFKDKDYQVLNVKPGIFGVNQLIYRREANLFPKDCDPEEFYIKELMPKKLENDINYNKKASVFSDTVILTRCIFAVVTEPFIAKWKWITRNQRSSVDMQIASEKDNLISKAS